MKIVALIPARKGSKRIKRKNLKRLLGKPLITWTIEAAKKVKKINSIFVSTDDEQIIKLCKKYNVNVPWKRPKSLSGDKVNSLNVALHFLNWYEKKYSRPDGLLLLQPTSPYRKKKSIEEAIPNAIHTTGRAIISTTVILSIGFFVLTFSEFVPNYEFGMLATIIMIVALFGAILLLPALIYNFRPTFGIKDTREIIQDERF